MKTVFKKSPRDLPGRKLAPETEALLNKAGLATENFIFFCKGDMTVDGLFCSSLVSFDEKGLYIAAYDEETVPPKKRGAHAEPQLTMRSLVSLPIDTIDRLEAERYLSTGCLVGTFDGEQRPLARFTLTCIKDFDDMVRAFNSFKETGTAKLPEEKDDDKGRCKKCGEPCPEGKDYCKKHDRSSATAVRLFRFFGGYVPQMSAVLLIMLLSSAAVIFVPQIGTRALFDNVLANPDGKTHAELIKALGVLVLSIFGVRLLNAVLTVIQQYVSATVMPGVMYDIKLKIFEAMQRLGLSFYSSKQTGSLMDRVVRDSNNIYWFFTDGLPRVILDGSTLIGVLIIMFIMNVRLSAITFVSLPIIVSVLVLGDRIFRRMHHRVWVYDAKLDSMISDNVNGQRVIKAFAKEDDELETFARASGRVRDAEIKLSLTEATLFPSMEMLVGILHAVIIGVGAVMVVRKEMTAGTLLSYVVYLEMLREPFGFLSWVSNWWSRCKDSAQRVFEICDAQPDVYEKEDAVEPDDIEGSIDISELTFEYEPARPVIKKLDLHVRAGEMLGIVGKTGAGKTTIANLIARLYDAKEGSVKIDGIDVRDLRLSSLRKNIGLVSQDIYLFIGSIADNIRYAKPEAGMEEVIAAAKAACAHDFIMKLPDAYETRVGAGGQRLSGGEKQRISIARTIIQNPKILILDEATAAMDTETERNIQLSLSKLKQGRTTIAIAHRLSTLRDSDHLAVIENGTVIEHGTYRELLKEKGEFYRQYKIQSEALKTIGISDSDDPDRETEGAENE